jgi:hypothetical protein
VTGETLFETIAWEATAESPLWAEALRSRDEWEAEPVFSSLCCEAFGLATESIYEGYLLHYGRPRLFTPPDDATAVLLGDYLYAHGLVRLARHENVGAVSDLAELISLCTQLRAENASPAADGAAWAATAALLGSGDARLERARAALRLQGDPGALHALAAGEAGTERVHAALAAHGARVE